MTTAPTSLNVFSIEITFFRIRRKFTKMTKCKVNKNGFAKMLRKSCLRKLWHVLLRFKFGIVFQYYVFVVHAFIAYYLQWRCVWGRANYVGCVVQFNETKMM